MASAWTSKTSWAVTGALLLAIGAGAIQFASHEPRVVLASTPDAAGPQEVVSRAGDSELEVSPTLAASRDGSIAVTWIAMMGGRDDGGRYVGARVSAPNAGRLSPLARVASAPPSMRVSDASVVAIGGDAHTFLVTWLSGPPDQPGDVYCARLTQAGAGAPVHVASGVRGHVRAVSTPEGAVMVFTPGAHGSVMLWTTRDGATFTSREVIAASATEQSEVTLGVCGDDRHALVATIAPAPDHTRVMVTDVPTNPEGPVQMTEVSTPSERVALDAPTCFVAGQEAFIVYGTTDKPRDDLGETAIDDSLVFARSKDDARTFWARVPYRPSSRMLHPSMLHGAGTFTLLAVMGGGIGDAHASTSLLILSADGRSQNGLTRTVVAPVTMVVNHDAAGYMGETFGLADVQGVTWAAVVDNASGESHVALVRVL